MYCPKIDDALINNIEITLLPDYHDKVKELFAKYNTLEGEREILPNWDLGRSAKDLMKKVLPPARWAVNNFIAEGLTLFSGMPKAGKSFFALQMATRVAAGKPFLGYKTRKGKVLYITLEDEERRIQGRLKQMGFNEDGEGLENLFLEYTSTWKRFAKKDGIKVITNYLKHWDGEVSLVIIDTLQRFRGEELENSSAYGADYSFMNGLQEIGSSTHTPIFSCHHTKKMATGNYITDASGTMGISGGVDHAFVLYREFNQNHAVIRGGGREVPSLEKWVLFDEEYCTFYPITEDLVPESAKQGTSKSEDKGPTVNEIILQILVKEQGKIQQDKLVSKIVASKNIADTTAIRAIGKLITDGYLNADGRGDSRIIKLPGK